MPNKFYRIKARANATAEVFIFGDIGESWYGDSVEASNFVEEFSALDATDITVRISSHGGSVTDGIAIYNAIKRHPATITVSVESIAASIASLIAMGGDSIEMADNARMMIHAPWGGVYGNAAQLREFADYLDGWAEAMAASYANKAGKDTADVLSLLTDGADHWYSADEALAAGFVDEVTGAIPLAASLDLSRYQKSMPPAAAAAFNINQESNMPKPTPTPAAPKNEPAAATLTPTATPEPTAPSAADVLAADQIRRNAIAGVFKPFVAYQGTAELMAACQNDHQCSEEDSNAKLLAHLSKGSEPAAGSYAVVLEDESEKFRKGVVAALMARASVAGVKIDAANPYRGHSLMDIARDCLARAGGNNYGMDKMQVVGAALTQSTSDFPILLEDAMHKTLQTAYAAAPDTWSRFCAKGSVSDFRAHKRYRVGSLGNLDSLNQNGEFKSKAIPDGEKASITADTVGNIINVSRQIIVNDDLGAFLGLLNMMGRAAHRTIEAGVYALLAENAGMGPLMSDGKALFHTDHGNIGAAGAMSVATIEGGRVLMAAQKDVGGKDFLDLRPSILLCGMGSGGNARVLNDAQYDPDTANKLQKPNVVRGLYSDIVDSPRLSGNRFYSFANPSDAPVIEVAFLDGNENPFLEQQAGFTVDGMSMKVRHDFGIGAIDYRGATTHAGE